MRLVRAIYDFSTTIPGEISLRKGDLVAVTAVINGDWLQGRSADSRQGIFPANFVEDVALPALLQQHHGCKLFLAKEDFVAGHPGDLGLKKGDVVVGISQVDTNWWSGRSSSVGQNTTGIFPLSFVTQLPFELDDRALLMPVAASRSDDDRFVASALSSASSATGHVLASGTGSAAAAIVSSSRCGTILPGPPRSESRDVCAATATGSPAPRGNDGCLYRVQAQVDAVAQLPEELSFRKGDVLTVMRVLDDDWYYGECKGKRGNFLRAFVERLADGCAAGAASAATASTATTSVTVPTNHGGRSGPAAPPASVSSELEKSRTPMHGQRPNDSSERAVRCGSRLQRAGCYRALYPFAARSSDELSFTSGDVIAEVEDVGGAWCRGRLGANVGMFPANYVQAVDGDRRAGGAVASHTEWRAQDSKVDESDSSTVLQQPLGQPTAAMAGDASGTNDVAAAARVAAASIGMARPVGVPSAPAVSVVLYNFRAEVAGEISVERGDTVVVLRELHGGWCEVSLGSDLSGIPRRGLCPIAYLSEPLGQPRSLVATAETIRGDGVSTMAAAAAAAEQSASHTAAVGGHLSNPSKVDSIVVASGTPNGGDISDSSGSCVRRLSDDNPVLLRPRAAVPLSSRRSWSPASSLDDVVAAEMAKLKAKPPIPSRPASLVGSPLSRPFPAQPPKSVPPPTMLQPPAISHRNSGVAVPLATAVESDERSVAVESLGTTAVAVPSGTVEETPPLVNSCAAQADAVTSCAEEPAEIVVSPALDTDRAVVSGTANVESNTAVAVSAATSTGDVVDSARALTATMDPSSAIPSSGGCAGVAVLRPARPMPPPPPSLLRTTSATKLVPSRPAPPVPVSRSAISEYVQAVSCRTSSSEKTNATLAARESDVAANSHGHAVEDLKNRIATLENDIKKMTVQLENIQYCSVSSDTAQEELDFYVSNINGMTAEMTELKESLKIMLPSGADEASNAVASCGADLATGEAVLLPTVRVTVEDSSTEAHGDKMKEQREKVIAEIKCTEESYLRDLQLSMKYFMSVDGPKHPDVDVETLFGNMEEVAAVSQKFLNRFDIYVSGKPFKEQCVGLPFVELADDMKKTYAVYCRNHDDVCVLLERYEEDGSIQAYFNSVLDLLRAETVVFDVGSFLIKPVQRILKYPLLLRELLKCTEDDHPDKTGLLQALDAVTDVASAINEYKRRKDLVYKYRKEKYATLSDKMASLNMHSVRKKSARLGMRLTATLGLSNQTKDPEFDREEATFRGLDRTIKTFLKDLILHMQLLEKSVSAQERLAASIRELYRDKPADVVTAYVKTQQTMVAELFKNFRSSVEARVLLPLTKLTAYYHGPSNVIQKRGDKLLDYDNCQLAYERAKDTDQASTAKQELVVAQKDYEALNQQLLVELPNLSRLSSLILTDGIAYYVHCYKEYIHSVLSVMYPLLQMPQLSTQGRPIMECFSAGHDAVASMVTRLCATAGPSSASTPPSRASFYSLPLSSASQQKPSAVPQLAETREQLIAKYAADHLYVVSSTPAGTDGAGSGTADMDLILEQGHVVAVLKTKDPMGDSTRWFVDDGAKKGFVLSTCLRPLSTASSSRAASAPSSPATSPRSPNGSRKEGQQQRRPSDVGPQLASPLLSPAAAEDGHRGQVSEEHAGHSGTHHSSEAMLVLPNQKLQKSTPPDSPRSSSPAVYEMEYWYALFTFNGRSSNEADLVAGQPVVVLQKHDASGNGCWWLVESRGRCGYAPSNYLASYQPQPSPAASAVASPYGAPPPYS